MNTVFSIACCILCLEWFSQETDGPKQVTQAIEKRIYQEVEKGVIDLKQKNKAAQLPEIFSEFAVDTFRITQYMAGYVEVDYSTGGMRTATIHAAKQYDQLLNKYYQKLLAKLTGEDKKALIQAQKAWLAYRDSEVKLIRVVSKDEYSGGGTIQQIIDSSLNLELVKDRVLALFDHLTRGVEQ
jgi:uncharacterized protein YecT (DUF1311 family)